MNKGIAEDDTVGEVVLLFLPIKYLVNISPGHYLFQATIICVLDYSASTLAPPSDQSSDRVSIFETVVTLIIFFLRLKFFKDFPLHFK